MNSAHLYIYSSLYKVYQSLRIHASSRLNFAYPTIFSYCILNTVLYIFVNHLLHVIYILIEIYACPFFKFLQEKRLPIHSMKTHIATVYNLCISYSVYYALQVSQKSFIPSNPHFNSLYLLYIHNQLACKAYTTFFTSCVPCITCLSCHVINILIIIYICLYFPIST